MFDQNRINLDDLSHFFSSSARNEGTLIQLPNIKSSLQLRAVSGTQSGVERGKIEKRKDNILWDYITRKNGLDKSIARGNMGREGGVIRYPDILGISPHQVKRC